MCFITEAAQAETSVSYFTESQAITLLSGTAAAATLLGTSVPCSAARAARVATVGYTAPSHLYYPHPSSLIRNLLGTKARLFSVAE